MPSMQQRRAYIIAQCPKGPRRGAEQQSVNYDGRQGDSAKSKPINSQTSSASSATSKEKNKAVSVVDEARGIAKQSIDVTLNGIIKTNLQWTQERHVPV